MDWMGEETSQTDPEVLGGRRKEEGRRNEAEEGRNAKGNEQEPPRPVD